MIERIQKLIDKFVEKHNKKPEAILISTDLLKQMEISTIDKSPQYVCGLRIKPLKASKDCIEIV